MDTKMLLFVFSAEQIAVGGEAKRREERIGMSGTPTRQQSSGTMKITIDHTSLITRLTKIKRWKRKRSLWFDLGILAALALLVVAVNQGVLRRHTVKASIAVTAAVPPAQHSDLSAKAEPAAAAPMIPASFRPLNFALLRGGFTSVDEFFERVKEDPILHSFYGDCSDRNASMHPLAEDITVFSTFRKDSQIKWASKPLRVRKGEYVMTFCGKTVLARCGNLISMAAMQPSEDVPPALLETPVDPIEPPLSYAATPSSDVFAPAAAVIPAAAVHGSHFFFIPPFYVPSGGSHITPLQPAGVPPPTSHISGDEFSGHQALFTLLLGLFAIGLVKLVTR
jgi:hypothetical protein